MTAIEGRSATSGEGLGGRREGRTDVRALYGAGGQDDLLGRVQSVHRT